MGCVVWMRCTCWRTWGRNATCGSLQEINLSVDDYVADRHLRGVASGIVDARTLLMRRWSQPSLSIHAMSSSSSNETVIPREARGARRAGDRAADALSSWPPSAAPLMQLTLRFERCRTSCRL